MKRRIKIHPYRKKSSIGPLLDVAPQKETMLDLGQARTEVRFLRAENELLRSTKQELASLRARMADHIFSLFE